MKLNRLCVFEVDWADDNDLGGPAIRTVTVVAATMEHAPSIAREAVLAEWKAKDGPVFPRTYSVRFKGFAYVEANRCE